MVLVMENLVEMVDQQVVVVLDTSNWWQHVPPIWISLKESPGHPIGDGNITSPGGFWMGNVGISVQVVKIVQNSLVVVEDFQVVPLVKAIN